MKIYLAPSVVHTDKTKSFILFLKDLLNGIIKLSDFLLTKHKPSQYLILSSGPKAHFRYMLFGLHGIWVVLWK